MVDHKGSPRRGGTNDHVTDDNLRVNESQSGSDLPFSLRRPNTQGFELR
jgi:hypothetical protein